jgi:hypothetical protein
VHDKEVEKAIYEFFENESEIKFFLDLIAVNKGKIQPEFYVQLNKELKRKGFILSDKKGEVILRLNILSICYF